MWEDFLEHAGELGYRLEAVPSADPDTIGKIMGEKEEIRNDDDSELDI